MPDGMSLMGDIWATRAKPVSTLWKGAKAGAPMGAALGLWAGGPVGAGVGAGVGTALGTITAASQRLVVSMQRLEISTRNLIEQYKAFNPAIARMRHQWTLLDRRLNRIWADTLAPMLKKLTDIGTELKERWARIKVDFFQAIAPHLIRMLDYFHRFARVTLWLTDKLMKAVGWILTGLEKLAEKLDWITKEPTREPTRGLSPFAIDWPTVEGPLTGAMRRTKLIGPPFTTEKREPVSPRKEELQELYEKGMLQGQPGEDVTWPIEELPKDIPGVNVSVNVGDSKELSAAFERVWLEATDLLRQIEAEGSYHAFKLQQEASYT